MRRTATWFRKRGATVSLLSLPVLVATGCAAQPRAETEQPDPTLASDHGGGADLRHRGGFPVTEGLVVSFVC